ncbi:MAG: DUF3575 domain-containing protein [Cytophagales bacterium]|nr:DUF3575 domain-containing protein [Cytophagales bacterium]
MKKIIFVICVIVLPSKLCGQEVVHDRNVDGKGRPIRTQHFKINLAALATGHLNIMYEYKLGRHVSVQMYADIVSGTNAYKTRLTNYIFNLQDRERFEYIGLSLTKLEGLSVQPELRYYLGSAACRGLYIGTYLNYRRYEFDFNISPGASILRLSNGTQRYNFNYLGIGLTVGMQWIVLNRVSIGIFAGMCFGKASDLDIGFRIQNTSNATLSRVENFKNPYKNTWLGADILPKFGITIGYCFGK